MPERNLDYFDDLLPSDPVKNDSEDNKPEPINFIGDNVLEGFIKNNDDADNNEPVEEPIQEPVDNFLHAFLKERGVEDPSKLQWEDEDGEVKDVDFDSLTDEDKLNILNSLSDPGLSEHETEVINYLRKNNVTLNQVIDYFSKKAVDEYVANNPDSAPQKTYTIDDYTDDELYLADLKSKYSNFTDEELLSKLETAKENEELFKKEVTALRDEYKKEEDAQIEAQKKQQEQAYEDMVNNLQDVLSNFNEVVLDSTDPESDAFEIEDSDKQQVLAYLLNQDSNGKSQLVKDLENPTTLIELAWLRTQSRALIDNTTRYWKDLLKEERKEKAKLQKELEKYKNKGNQSVVVPKQNNNDDSSNNSSDLDSVWNNLL